MNWEGSSVNWRVWSQSRGSLIRRRVLIWANILGSEMIQRIDANTEDVVDNVQGAQRELMKYWSRVSGNRWLIAKMFGVLMVRLQT